MAVLVPILYELTPLWFEETFKTSRKQAQNRLELGNVYSLSPELFGACCTVADKSNCSFAFAGRSFVRKY
jgi:hypothetical protein